MYMLNMVIILIVMYCNVVTAIDKIPMYLLRFNNPNHLLGSFPCLFPYGLGGFKVARRYNVSYDMHARWALHYEDHRFRTDLHFMFSVSFKSVACVCLQFCRSRNNLFFILSLQSETWTVPISRRLPHRSAHVKGSQIQQ